MTLKEIRKNKSLTQKNCAQYLGIPLRTYQNYENDKSKIGSMKYIFMIEKLSEYGFVDETHGILSVEEIKRKCTSVFENYEIEYCYLFGSYAKGIATESSDVDLLISSTISGIQYYELVETLRERLRKNVDLLNKEQINNNFELVNEILRDGIKIYG